ncbi:hypothetical protein C474_13614 [Halogeometricum pallidum JCM 14848]|uniref:Uncharacterized protein n=1 Tax=Halogeometricum pallidum JCM 14848 TaxID=1227487 RepID=M0D350_HALPD|nr:hypothetical protein C474_13614 [Halogeometricum pallidum JCM 14848]
MTPPSDDSPSTGPPDRQTLRLLERILSDDPLVATTEYEPDSYEPRLLRVRFDLDRYPPAIESARLDLRWFTTGDFSLHYVETVSNGEHWECRWDRHPNPHNARVHFHRPPAGEKVEDLTLESHHPIDVGSTVLAAIERRIADQWSADDPGQ